MTIQPWSLRRLGGRSVRRGEQLFGAGLLAVHSATEQELCRLVAAIRKYNDGTVKSRRAASLYVDVGNAGAAAAAGTRLDFYRSADG